MERLPPTRSRWRPPRAPPIAAPRRETPSTRSCKGHPSTRRPPPSRPVNCPSGRPPEAWFARKRERRSRARARQQARGGSLRGHSVRCLTFGYEFSRQRNEFAAVFDGVDQRIKASDQEMADAEIVVVAEHFGDLFG